MTTKSKVPHIRFGGFSGEWDNIKFDESFTNIPNNNLSRAELNYESGLAKNVHYGDVLIKFGELLDIEKEKVPFISNNDFVVKFKSSRLQNGDMIIADAAEDEMVGKCTEIVNINDEMVFSGLHTIAIRPTNEFASKYLGYYMNSSSYHNQLLPLLQGTKVLSISKSTIKNTEILFPKEQAEQTKIGDYFQKLDKLIEQKEKKYQKLKEFKKAMLSKMFPKNGATIPEIRFGGFSGEWEEKSLGDISKITTGKSNREDSGINGKYTFFDRSDDIRTSDIYLFDCEAVIVAGEGSDFVPKYFIGKFDLHQRTYAIMNFELLDGKFLFYYIHLFRKYFLGQAVGSTVKSLRLPMFQEMPIKFPEKAEQTKIGNYFQKLDSQIELQLQELQKLKNIKKASLAKMFV
ncbi:MAG: hypothetical protein KU38_02990 [Sulfurovum sp. FS08-3]|nr:MAG: hypothetical protein KU38_02990 [Sulfurovum sp. FS08-3]